jgi:hypothetical protein
MLSNNTEEVGSSEVHTMNKNFTDCLFSLFRDMYTFDVAAVASYQLGMNRLLESGEDMEMHYPSAIDLRNTIAKVRNHWLSLEYFFMTASTVSNILGGEIGEAGIGAETNQ